MNEDACSKSRREGRMARQLKDEVSALLGVCIYKVCFCLPIDSRGGIRRSHLVRHGDWEQRRKGVQLANPLISDTQSMKAHRVDGWVREGGLSALAKLPRFQGNLYPTTEGRLKAGSI